MSFLKMNVTKDSLSPGRWKSQLHSYTNCWCSFIDVSLVFMLKS